MLNEWNEVALHDYTIIKFTNIKDFIDVISAVNCTGSYGLVPGCLPASYELYTVKLHYYLGMFHSFYQVFNDSESMVLKPGINCNNLLDSSWMYFVFGVQVTNKQKNKLKHIYIECKNNIQQFNCELAQIALQNSILVEELKANNLDINAQAKTQQHLNSIKNINSKFQQWKASQKNQP